jgi:repressor LexA
MMMEKRKEDLADFYKRSGRMPSFSELASLWGLKSKNAVFKAVGKLEAAGVVKRDEKGRLIPLSLSSHLRIMGTVAAGFPSPAEEELADTISLDDLLIDNRSATFLLKVSGDSMIDEGIKPGNMVIVDKSRLAKNGDIVIAEVDGEWTMKFLQKKDGNVSLVAANPLYKPIIPKTELKIAGVVTAVVRQYS